MKHVIAALAVLLVFSAVSTPARADGIVTLIAVPPHVDYEDQYAAYAARMVMNNFGEALFRFNNDARVKAAGFTAVALQKVVANKNYSPMIDSFYQVVNDNNITRMKEILDKNQANLFVWVDFDFQALAANCKKPEKPSKKDPYLCELPATVGMFEKDMIITAPLTLLYDPSAHFFTEASFNQVPAAVANLLYQNYHIQ